MAVAVRRSTGRRAGRDPAGEVGNRRGHPVRPRLGDVFALTFAGLALAKVNDAGLALGPAFAIAWVLACLAAPFWRPIWLALAGLALAGWASPAPEMASNYVALIAWVSVIFYAAEGETRQTLLRSQAAVVYAFAAVNKASSYAFVSGVVVAERSRLPEWVGSPAAVATVMAEGWLAWAVWRRSRWALPVSVVLHVGIVLGMTTSPFLLVAFNGTMVLMVWEATRRQPATRE